VVTRLTDHDEVIKPLVKQALRFGLTLGPAPAGVGPASDCD